MGRPRTPVGLAALVAAAAVVIALVVSLGGGSPAVTRHTMRVAVGPDADGSPITLDAELFVPAHTPAPAVVLAHGFGGTKDDETSDALYLARRGYVVLTYSARGFGRSGGRIHIDAPDFEVQDARRLVDLLGRSREVLRDGPDDPRVGVAGASYGGALSLLAAGYDRRVDAIAPSITWNDLGQALFPQFAVTAPSRTTPASVSPVPGGGVFKRTWAGLFFASGAEGRAANTTCGRFAADVCAAYQQAAASGAPTPSILALLRRSSPATVLGRIHAPTLLIQGETDSLFPLSEGDANARGIAANGTPVKVVWYGGGHDGGASDTARLRSLTLAWFGRYLAHDGSRPDTRFEVTVPAAVLTGGDPSPQSQTRVAPALPGTTSRPAASTTIALRRGAQTIVSPAGGNPALLTGLPGLGPLIGQLASQLPQAPGQSARFESAPLHRSMRVTGAPSITLSVASSAPDATLFAALYDVSGDGRSAALPQQLVSPVRLTGLSGASRTVTVALPAVVHDFAAGHRLRVVVSSTDQAYALPADARTYRIDLAGDRSVTVPQVTSSLLGGTAGTRLAVVAALGLGALLLAGGAAAVLARRGRRSDVDESVAHLPLVIEGLGKAYADGFRAVSDLTFSVQAGQVLGLLGPNGAGKTTTLRMLMGLIRPSEGVIRVFGHRVTSGAPVLSRVGAFVEGPGFLPHLTGRDNLELFWRATGRPPDDARLDTALEVAGLDEDLGRRVRTYSQGMRQRLAIAQAMLGLPDLLVLDEPTNGLDPPQIREMREVLARYAATGRTVVVSSHLLAEVEQTCTHVVVMHHGRLVAQGPVAELVGQSTSVSVDVDDPARAGAVLRALAGVGDVAATSSGLTLRLAGASRGDVVRARVREGLDVERVAPQRGLEEAFLTLVGEE